MTRQYLSAPPQVALLFETNEQAHRDILRGVLRYEQIHGPWSLHVAEGRAGEQRLPALKGWNGSGMIGVIQNRAYAEAVLAADVPAVLIDPLDAVQLPDGLLQRHSVFASDLRAIGELAADYYLERGFTYFGFVGEIHDINWSRERGAAFAARVHAVGHQCEMYGPLTAHERQDWSRERQRLCTWLTALPKPAAVFVAMDVRGRQVLDACRMAGLRVPHEVAVLAVDNDELICGSTMPPLSSIALDTDRMGFEAARLLDQLMRRARGRRPRRVERVFPPLKVVTRRSTETIPIADPVVARALEYIWLNAQNPVGVPEIVQHSGVSRRSLEMRFRACVGVTLQDELQRTRLKRVRALLAETNHSVRAIAHACGFTSASYLGKVFRRTFGMTMTQYRAQR
ncbi:MAG: XylR family transcriptional regulator [Kiritimatiellae bacterium]|mgnify:FL=1|jgi:LacI family transcriptional regulator|nr:XylR family transcriptional regulator [Kiritimatiellia bacterium]MDD2347391.1 XylR family transcriptional regulator [Kiritimatiellia bacterium]MDD3583270.1 XylR family transcriptional regulator [Kiritimatiellia bacterium]HHU16070.1 substrate-binding domain-containing protein [Lentisphaerota bacterium]HON47368.1 XylR family transcriptional regulator [Kiritimatiellia bacterium]